MDGTAAERIFASKVVSEQGNNYLVGMPSYILCPTQYFLFGKIRTCTCKYSKLTNLNHSYQKNLTIEVYTAGNPGLGGGGGGGGGGGNVPLVSISSSTFYVYIIHR